MQPRLALLLIAVLLWLPVHVHGQAAPAAAAQKDVLVFTNGDTLSGKLERAVSGSVVFKSDMAGELTVPIGKIRELRSNGSFVVLRKNEPVINRVPPASGTLLLADGSIALAAKDGHVTTVPAAEAAYVIDQSSFDKEIAHHASLLSGWNGTASAGATFVRSTTNGETFTAGLSAVRAIPTVPYLPPRNRTSADISETYGSLSTPAIPPTVPQTSSTVKTSIFHADAERDEYLTKRVFLLGLVTFDHNFSQGLDLQQVYGAGVGATLVSTPKQQFDTRVDAHYERQAFFTPASNLNLIGATVQENYKRTLPAKIIFTESADFLPAFNDTRAYAADFSAGLTLPAYKRLSVNFSTVDNYLNDPAPFYRKNSFQFVTALTYTLR